MSDIPPKAIEKGTFKKFLMELGSRADLDILRQVNKEYYQALNSTFLDSVAKDFQIICPISGRRAPELFELADGEEDMLENNEEAENEEDQILEDEILEDEILEDEDSGEDDLLDELEMNDENQRLYDVRTNDGRHLDLQIWTPKIAHIFRKLEFKEVWIVELKREDLPLYEIVTQLAPYITTLRLNTLPLDSENPGLKYSEFLNGFTNLKYLEIDFIVGPLRFYNVQGMAIDQLEIGVANLQLKPNITFYAEQNHQEILAKFGAMENVSFNLHFDVFDLEANPIMETIAEIQNSLILGEIKYSFKFDCRTFRNFKAFTEIFIKPQMENHIEKLHLFFNFDKRGFQEGDREGIVNCLTILSPYVTFLHVRLRSKPTWDILNHDFEWPKLTELQIVGYNYPLEILKKCTNLEILQLEIDQDVCIFHNHQQSEKESLKEYFGNLPHFEGINFLRGKIGDKLAHGNELDKYFKEILPKPCLTQYPESDGNENEGLDKEENLDEEGSDSGGDSDDNEDL